MGVAPSKRVLPQDVCVLKWQLLWVPVPCSVRIDRAHPRLKLRRSGAVETEDPRYGASLWAQSGCILLTSSDGRGLPGVVWETTPEATRKDRAPSIGAHGS